MTSSTLSLRSRVDATLLALERERTGNVASKARIEELERKLLEDSAALGLREDNEKLRAIELKRKIRAARTSALHTTLGDMLDKDIVNEETACMEAFEKECRLFREYLRRIKHGDAFSSKIKIALRDIRQKEATVGKTLERLHELKSLRRKCVWTKAKLKDVNAAYMKAARNLEAKQASAASISKRWNAVESRITEARRALEPLKDMKKRLLRDEEASSQDLISAQLEAARIREEENKDRTWRNLMRAHDMGGKTASSEPKYLIEAANKLNGILDDIERELVKRRKTDALHERTINEYYRFRRQVRTMVENSFLEREREDRACDALYAFVSNKQLVDFDALSSIKGSDSVSRIARKY